VGRWTLEIDSATVDMTDWAMAWDVVAVDTVS